MVIKYYIKYFGGVFLGWQKKKEIQYRAALWVFHNLVAHLPCTAALPGNRAFEKQQVCHSDLAACRRFDEHRLRFSHGMAV